MTISLEKVGKRFNREWIFRNITRNFDPGTSVAITGPNGSGKSTLLQIIAGSLTATEGSVKYDNQGEQVADDQFFKHLTLVAPYLEIIDDFTLEEFLTFHFKFKKLKEGIDAKQLPMLLQLPNTAKKPIKNFSTGMRQRVKLGICFYSECEVMLLDEPTTNLDKNGIDWYLSEIEKSLSERTIIVSSNSEEEYSFCRDKIDINSYK